MTDIKELCLEVIRRWGQCLERYGPRGRQPSRAEARLFASYAGFVRGAQVTLLYPQSSVFSHGQPIEYLWDFRVFWEAKMTSEWYLVAQTASIMMNRFS